MTDDRRRRFDALIVPHLDDALSLARWLTGNGADAEDVVQEACIRAFGALDACSDASSRGWLLTIVRNSAFTWMARNRPKSVLVTDDIQMFETNGSAMLPETSDPEAALIAKVDSELLHQAIAELPIAYREALVLREFNGCSYREIADIISVPVGTVMSRLARARATLVAAVLRLERTPSTAAVTVP